MGVLSSGTLRDPVAHHPTSTRRPADFDEFWAETLSSAARIPLEPGEAAIVLQRMRAILSQVPA
jgi:hypothetical protein